MKELRFKQNKGFWGLLITGIMLIVVGIAFIIGFTTKTADSMYSDGDVYGRTTIKQDKAMAVAITATSGELTTQDGNSYYVIETEDQKYIALEVPEKFAQFHKEDGSEFEPSLKLAVKVGKWNEETQKKWYKVAQNFGIEDDFEDVYFLSTVDYDNSNMWATIFAACAIVLGGVVIFSAFKKRKGNSKAYDELVAIYPELKDNLTLAKTDGLFSSDVIKFYVYKNHLLSVKNGFDVLDLSQVIWMDFTTTTYRGNTTAELPYLLDGETKQKSFGFGNYAKKHITDMERFFDMLEQNFPNIALGSENRPEHVDGAINSKKTIAEFVAEQQAKQQIQQETEVATEENTVVQEEVDQPVSDVASSEEIKENKDEA